MKRGEKKERSGEDSSECVLRDLFVVVYYIDTSHYTRSFSINIFYKLHLFLSFQRNDIPYLNVYGRAGAACDYCARPAITSFQEVT